MEWADWIFVGTPPADKPGWYAALICYDEQEGAFPSAAEWDGAAWKQKAVVGFGERRPTQKEALELACEDDPDANYSIADTKP